MPTIIEMPPFTSGEPACAANRVFLRKGTLLETSFLFKSSRKSFRNVASITKGGDIFEFARICRWDLAKSLP